MVVKYSKTYIAEFVQLYVRQTMIYDDEVVVELLDDWTLHIKKNILDGVFEEYIYYATRDGVKKLHRGYYYPDDDTLHILC